MCLTKLIVQEERLNLVSRAGSSYNTPNILQFFCVLWRKKNIAQGMLLKEINQQQQGVMILPNQNWLVVLYYSNVSSWIYIFFDSLKNDVMIWSIYSNFDCCGTSRKQVVVNYFIVCSTVNQRNKQTNKRNFLYYGETTICLEDFSMAESCAFFSERYKQLTLETTCTSTNECLLTDSYTETYPF